MKIKLYLTLLTTISILNFGYSQNSLSKKILKEIDKANYKKAINSLPSFTMFGDNYFVTGTSTKKNAFTSDGSDTKFQIGFKQLLTNVELPLRVFPFITYRQKAFWDTYKESLPFRELNYNPAVGMARLFFRKQKIRSAYYLSFEHESNGRDEDNSRSWNFLALTYFKRIGKNIQLMAKAWLPVGSLSDNPDIISYKGLFNVVGTYKFNEKLYVDLFLQPAYDKSLQGSIKAAISYKISEHNMV